MDSFALVTGYLFIMLFVACLLYFIFAVATMTIKRKIYCPIKDYIKYKTPSIVSCRCYDCLYADKIKNAKWAVFCTKFRKEMPSKGFCSYAYRFESKEEEA